MSRILIAFLLRVWRILPLWVHIMGVRLVRPRYRVGVVATVFDEQGCILLFKHTYRKLEWGLPAGGLEIGEDPEEGIRREFLEETGIHIGVQRLLLAVSSREDRHISLIFLCRIIEGAFRPSLEISEMKYFDVKQLPAMLYEEKDMIGRLAQMNSEIANELA